MSRIFKKKLDRIDGVEVVDSTQKRGMVAIDFILFDLPPGVREHVIENQAPGKEMNAFRGAGSNNSVAIYQNGQIVQFALRLPPRDEGKEFAKEASEYAEFPGKVDISIVPKWEIPEVIVWDVNLGENEFLGMLGNFLSVYQPQEVDFTEEDLKEIVDEFYPKAGR